MLAIFCDLAEEDQADFRPWLTEDMFPARIQIGFNACASFDKVNGDGPSFVTLYEMPNLGHLYGAPYQALRRERKPRDTAYHKKFQNLERYTLSWTGPELSPETNDSINGFSSYIHIDRINLPEGEIEKFNIWFIDTYLPSLAEIQGLLRTRRYLAMEGVSPHFVLHEFSDASVVESSEWLRIRNYFHRGKTSFYKRVIQMI